MMKYSLPSRARMVCVTSPDIKRFSEATKIDGYIIVVMGLWMWSEIIYWWNHNVLTMSLDDVRDRFTKWGGIARYAFKKFFGESRLLEEAITACRVDVLGKNFGLESFADREHNSHKIFQLKADPNAGYEYAGLDYVSDWVRDRVITNACQQEISDMKKFVRSTAGIGPLGSLRGSTFEGLTHILLRKGGNFVIRALDSVVLENISLPCLEQKSFTEWDQVQNCIENRYFRPVSNCLEAVDSLERPNILFQMTVAGTHPIHAFGLIESIKKLGCIGDVCLYFPLPVDRFNDFGKQKYRWPRATENEDESARKSRKAAQAKGNKFLGRVKQFALLIELQPSGLPLMRTGKRRRQAAAGGIDGEGHVSQQVKNRRPPKKLHRGEPRSVATGAPAVAATEFGVTP